MSLTVGEEGASALPASGVPWVGLLPALPPAPASVAFGAPPLGVPARPFGVPAPPFGAPALFGGGSTLGPPSALARPPDPVMPAILGGGGDAVGPLGGVFVGGL